MSNFLPLEVVGSGSEIQFQVGPNFKWIPKYGKGFIQI